MRQEQLHLPPCLWAVWGQACSLHLSKARGIQSKEPKVNPILTGNREEPQATPQATRCPTPIKLPQLKSLMLCYLNHLVAHSLSDGFEFGFRIPALSPLHPTWAKNLPSVLDREEVVHRKIGREIKAGRVVGPFKEPPFLNLRISPLGVVAKNTPGELRLIHHFSFPKGGSLNEVIPHHLCMVRYTTLDEAVCLLWTCGTGALMGKKDIESAFQLLPVYLDDFCQLGSNLTAGTIMTRLY